MTPNDRVWRCTGTKPIITAAAWPTCVTFPRVRRLKETYPLLSRILRRLSANGLWEFHVLPFGLFLLSICQWIDSTRLNVVMRQSNWAFPALDTIHTLGIVLVAGPSCWWIFACWGWVCGA